MPRTPQPPKYSVLVCLYRRPRTARLTSVAAACLPWSACLAWPMQSFRDIESILKSVAQTRQKEKQMKGNEKNIDAMRVKGLQVRGGKGGRAGWATYRLAGRARDR
eukprot:SAG22_NODE_7044_length_782_cov_1.468521_1_plen_106_part_00